MSSEYLSDKISDVLSNLYSVIKSCDDDTQINVLKNIQDLLILFEERDTVIMSVIKNKLDDIIHEVKMLEFDLYATKVERDALITKYKDY